MMNAFSCDIFGQLTQTELHKPNITPFLFQLLFAPFIGWLADVKFGRYEILKFASIILSFFGSILFYMALISESGSTLSTVLYSTARVVITFGGTCFLAAMVPFLTDQLIGASSQELSAAVQWYIWACAFGMGLSQTMYMLVISPNYQVIDVGIVLIFAVPLAVIIISDCLCQQWLDRTHKVSNPIKLIIQVLNYTRKHSYPERRSAFTYIDEEQPTRMDFGKQKYGGPFTEEEVEDVKTVLRLIPLVICLSLFVGAEVTPVVLLQPTTALMFAYYDTGANYWLLPLLLIPLYRFLLHRFIHRYTPSMLNSLAIGLALHLVGYTALEALVIKGVVDSDDAQSYLSCVTNTTSVHYVEWYWKVGPYLLYGVGMTIIIVLLYELIIAQSPDKMKGLVYGISIAFYATSNYIASLKIAGLEFTLCHSLLTTVLLVALFVVFLVLSKCYTLRERNREINIQAIVEEHYERYMDQEEYMREQRYIRENILRNN